MITIQKVTSNVQSVPLPVSRHLLTRRTVFSKTVFSIARSTFRMYSVMAIFMVGDWNSLKFCIFACFLCCNRQVHRDFWSPRIFNLRAVEFLIFIKPKFTTHALNVLHPNQCTVQWTVRGGCEVVWQASKLVAELSLSFQLEMNTQWFASDPTDKNPKDCAEHVDGLCFEKCLRMNIDTNMFPWFRGGT
jgi:hypothetical protein